MTPHPFTLRQLQYVVSIADLRSFGGAARACHVAQPSLSAQVAQVEEVLGVLLFERGRAGVRPTPAGEAFVESARRVLAEADALVLVSQRFVDPFLGTWRVGVIPTIAPYLLPIFAPALRERWPTLNVRWVEERTPELVRRIQSGELDAALLAREADIGRCEVAVLGEDPFVLAAPPSHPLFATLGPASAESLDGQRVLLLDDGHCFRDQALDVCSRAGATELGFRATSLPTLAQMVASGAGVTLLPQLAVATEATRAGLAVRPFAAPAPHRTVALVWRPGASLGAALAEVAAYLRERWPSARADALGCAAGG